MVREIMAFLTINLKSHSSWIYMKKGKALFDAERNKAEETFNTSYYELLQYAYIHTDYYHRVFDKIGLFQNDELQKDKIDQIPVLTKEIIRQEKDNLYSDEMYSRGVYNNTSGGSTGEPVTFVQDKEYFSKNFGDKLLFGILNDKNPGEKEIKLWGSERDILNGTIGFKEKIINFCFNREFMNSFVLSSENMPDYVDRINKLRPKQIWAYAESIYQLSKFINERNIKIFSPQNIITTAGVLYDEMREEIKSAFPNTRILNQYGSREAGVIACEIGNVNGLRIFDHSVRVEILREDGRISDYGEGELLITNYTNLSMPLIRYKIGDTGVKVKNDGYYGSFSVLKQITGRTNSHLKKADGSLVHGEYVTHLFYNKKWIENFRVIQHDYKNIEFQIVIRSGFERNEDDLKCMENDLKYVMGDINIDVNYFETISKLKSGKYQFVISEI